MKCYLCGTGTLVPAKTTLELFDGKIAVQNVSCKKCDSCGETFFSEQERKRVFQKVDEAKKALHSFRVVKSVSV
ncbi:MAG: YgiT-type zinc finger protein [Candidatus Diapherotrites archaeon]